MEDKTKTRFYFLLRFFRNGVPDIYAGCTIYGCRREWYPSKTQVAVAATTHSRARPAHDARADAYRFPKRGDARSALKSPAFEELVKGKRAEYGRNAGNHREETRYFWEIIKVTETIVTSFEEEIVVSDAPPMLTIARSV